MAHLIDVRDACKIYRQGGEEIRALDHVSFWVDEGEFVAIIGQSGSGKSTLMNLLGCLDAPTSGSYFLDGQDVSQLGEAELSRIRNREIGFVFQGFNLIPSLDAAENVELPLLYRGIPRAERRQLSRRALQSVGLENRLHHLPSQMSGGQQQRVAVARAIAASPPVLLADEPTGNLDSRSGAEVMGILRRLNGQGKTVVLITHDPGIAGQAGRTVTIQDGRIVS
ncbi:MAG TPA: ABC transporter ATP-binding protein [Candidatus Gallacutalibacter pullicola]|uniref:ABC transporter ATP-binding protein n=1 Tax=Candidatus Gallacutalibacter pullicola TaxID=2840830 RepID=A0A9D1DP12_9FIRM|nr:ABC transporter ATP-binding protein [Candidatus Gallacutalibacter pullicola]